MEEEIRDDEFHARCGSSPVMSFGRDKRGKPILASKKIDCGIRNAGLAIHKKEAGSMSAMRKRNGEDGGEEVSVAATEID
jgi:hypothetical protein